MRILTAGFDRDETERIGDALTSAQHTVLSASGAASCRTFAESVTPEILMIPIGAPGDDALTWAPDLIADVTIVRLAEGDDPLDALNLEDAPPTVMDTAPPEAIAESVHPPAPGQAKNGVQTGAVSISL